MRGYQIKIRVFQSYGAARSAGTSRRRIGFATLKGNGPMNTSHLDALRAKHAGLEAKLRQEQARPAPDETMVQQLKRQKLKLKEEIAAG